MSKPRTAPKPRDRRTRAELAAALRAADAELLTMSARLDAVRGQRNAACEAWGKTTNELTTASAERDALRAERDALKARAEQSAHWQSSLDLMRAADRDELRRVSEDVARLRAALTSAALVLAERDADLREAREERDGLRRRLARSGPSAPCAHAPGLSAPGSSAPRAPAPAGSADAVQKAVADLAAGAKAGAAS